MNDTLENGTDYSTSISMEHLAFTTTSLAISLILILPSNSYVLWLILSGAGGGTLTSEFFYLNLTASVIVSTLASVLNFAVFFTFNLTLHMVSFFIFLLFLCFSVPLFQCCICVERYIAVVHPVVFLRYKALRYRVACCCVVWMVMLAFTVLYYWLYKAMTYVFLGLCIVCISVVSFCCLSVLRALKQPGPGEGQRDSSGNDMKNRAFRIILISLVVMVATMACYIPYILPKLSRETQNLFSPVAVFVTYAVVRLSGFVHALVYIHKAGKLPCFS